MGDPATSGRATLHAFAPDAAACLDRLVAARPIDVYRLALVRRTCAAVHGLEPLGSADDGKPPRSDDDAVERFAAQFSADVAAIDDACRRRFLDACGDDSFAAVQAVWIADMVPRARAALDAVVGRSVAWPEPEPGVEGVDAWGLVDDFIVTVHRLDGLDPVTSEVVRLRGARQHRCRLCQSLRSRPALIAGGDDALWAGLDEPSSLDSPVHRAAVGMVDAMIWTPGRLSSEVVAAVRATMTPRQAVELVLDVVRNAANKIAVALAADEAHVSEGVEVYEVDPDGAMRYGLDVPEV